MEIRNIVVHCKEGSDTIDPVSVIQKANEYKSLIRLEYQNKSANAKSLLSVMAFHLEPDMQINVTADGPDEKEAADAVASVLQSPEK